MSEVASELSAEEKKSLDEHEEIIRSGRLMSFVDVGKALLAIRDRRLYREFESFEEYCKHKWDIARRTAYQYIDAALVIDDVCSIAHIQPANESQARCLVSVPREMRAKAWKEAVESAPQKEDGTPQLTASHIRRAISKYIDTAVDEPRSWELYEAMDHLLATVIEMSKKWPQDSLDVLGYRLQSLGYELLANGVIAE